MTESREFCFKKRLNFLRKSKARESKVAENVTNSQQKLPKNKENKIKYCFSNKRKVTKCKIKK